MSIGRRLASKGHYAATFRSLFGDVPVRVRRLLACPCQGTGGAKSFAAFDLEAATVAPELAYVTARYAALAPFGKVSMQVGESVIPPGVTKTAEPTAAQSTKRIKGLCGAKPPQKPRWTNAVRWEAIERYGDFTRDVWWRGGQVCLGGREVSGTTAASRSMKAVSGWSASSFGSR
ncbi:MAG TPA: hypothetical protein VHT74_34675 [Acetobacteraceae bacterium]|nr:hypothetical protein [Acetobacteraceae bacterium]